MTSPTECTGCKHHRVVFFETPHSPDGIKGTFRDRCLRYADDPPPDNAVGWCCVLETADPPAHATACGPTRRHYAARET